jgi:hypothetical protein
MNIPTAAIVPLFLISFVLLAFQYFRINPDRRLLNLHFGLMIGAIVFALVQVAYPGGHSRWCCWWLACVGSASRSICCA